MSRVRQRYLSKELAFWTRRPLCLIALFLFLGCFLLQNLTGSYNLSAGGITESDFEEDNTLKARIIAKEETADSYRILCCLQNQRNRRFYCLFTCEPRDLAIGMIISVKGEWQEYGQATNPGQFDTGQYYACKRIYGYLVSPQVTILVNAPSGYENLKEFLYGLRRNASAVLDRIAPETEGGILKAMLLGVRSDLDSEVKQLYRGAGISHVLAISGLHIALLGDTLYKILKRCRLPRGVTVSVSILIMILYGLFTGAAVSVVRAVFMFALRLVASLFHRTYDSLTACCLAAALLILDNPGYLYESAFLFSFGAVLGIAILTPALQDYFPKPGRKTLKSRILLAISRSLTASLAVTLMTLPVLLYFYYEVPVFSFLLNLLIIPLMTPIVLSGMGGLLTGAVWIPAGRIVVCPAVWLLRFYTLVCEWVTSHPQWTVITGRPTLGQIVLFYGGMILFARLLWGIRHSNSKREKKTGHRILALFLPLLAVCFLTVHYRTQTEVWFLDVGQGDCICILEESGATYVIDCGSTSKQSVGERILIPFLKYNGVREIDCVYLSHLDKDHISGIEELTAGKSNLAIREIAISSLTYLDNWQDSAVCENAGNLGIPLRIASGGEDTDPFYVLYPVSGSQGSDESNADSLVLLYRAPDFYVLLTGDISATEETLCIAPFRSLFEQGGSLWEDGDKPLILKAAHHGSRYSSSDRFLTAIRAKAAVISVGRNSYGHPTTEAMDRILAAGTELYRTDKGGAVRVYARNKEVKITVFLEGEM